MRLKFWFSTLCVGLVLALGCNAVAQSGTFTTTGSLNTPRDSQTANLLANGMVLIAGGYDAG